MADLRTSLGPLELKNPLVVASAITTKTVERIKKAEACGAAAVIAKAIVTKDPYRSLRGSGGHCQGHCHQRSVFRFAPLL
jgi:hypothetical protein